MTRAGDAGALDRKMREAASQLEVPVIAMFCLSAATVSDLKSVPIHMTRRLSREVID